MHVHIWPSRMRLVEAAKAAMSVHASCVASSVGDGRGVEVVVDPQRLPRAFVGLLGERRHHAPLVGGVDADEVEAPALGDEGSESHGPSLGVRARRSITAACGIRSRITAIASGLSSTSTASRPSADATAPVVPLPAKKSSTRSPGRARRLHDAAQDALGLLRRVAGLLAPGRRHDRVPPHVGGELAALGLLGRDEPGRHVRLAVDGLGVEPVRRRDP